MWKPAMGTSLAVIVGWVSANAMVAAQERSRPERGQPRPRWVMVLDVNRDGKLDANEIAEASERLKASDDNGDGELVLSELMPDEGHGEHGRYGHSQRQDAPPNAPLRAGSPRRNQGEWLHPKREEIGPPHRGFGPPWMRREFGRPGFGRPGFGRPGFGSQGPGEFHDPHAPRGPQGPTAPGIEHRGADKPVPPSHPSPPRFEELDKNSDGVVDREEFSAVRPPHQEAHKPPKREHGPSERNPHMDRGSRQRGGHKRENDNATVAESLWPSSADGDEGQK